MQVRMVRNPHALRHIARQMLGDRDIPKEIVLETLQQQLAIANPFICVVVLINDRNDSVIGHIIAQTDQLAKHVFIHQAVIKPGTPKHGSKMIFQAVKNWAMAMDKKYLRMETTRDPAAFHRAWGFVEVSKVMEYDLEKTELEEFNPNEAADGQEQQTNDHVGSDERPEGHPVDHAGLSGEQGQERAGEGDGVREA